MESKSYYLVDKGIMNEYNLSGEALFVWIILRRYFSKKSEVAISCGLLEYLIDGYENPVEGRSEAVTKGLIELISHDIINVKAKMKNKILVLDISNLLKLEKGCFYVSIYKEEFFKIINLDCDVSNYNLLKFFLQTVGTFDGRNTTDEKYRKKIGLLSQNSLSSICRISIPTLIKYSDILTKEKILYVMHRKTIQRINGGKLLYKGMSNIYGRYEDANLCEEYLKEHGFIKRKDLYVNISNEMRSLSQKYNYFVRTYKEEPCQDLEKVRRAYNAAVQWNEYAKKDFDQSVQDGKKVEEPKYKDLSIFDQYDLTI